MKRFLALSLAGTAVLRAEPAAVTAAAQALADGLPQVAIRRLTESPAPKGPEAELLLGRSYAAAGRYQEAAARLRPLAATNATAAFFLAESHAGLGEPEKARPWYRAAAVDPGWAGPAVRGEARALAAMQRRGLAMDALKARLAAEPADEDTALALAALAIDARDTATAAAALDGLETLSPTAAYLRGRLALSEGRAAEARGLLDAITTPPADIAAGVAIARAECLLRLGEPAAAETVLETFIQENFRLPGLAETFAALDRVYASQPSSSSAELQRWSADRDEPLRAGLATYYLARNEARVGNAAGARQIDEYFLQTFPGNPLGRAARIALAESWIAAGEPGRGLSALEGESGGRASFLEGQARAALGDPAAAMTAFLAAADDPLLEREALANAALCGVLGGVPDDRNDGLRRLAGLKSPDFALDRLAFLDALHHAAQRKPDAPELLATVADRPSAYAPQARLALAEWEAQELDLPAARRELTRIANTPDTDPRTVERAAALNVFVADTGEPGTSAEVQRLATEFLRTYPDSDFAAEIHLKLGELYFRRGDYLAARGEFMEIAERFPKSPLAEKAVFLTARAMERSMDPQTMNEAVDIYESVVKTGGPLAQRARLAQAILFNALGKPQDALRVLDNLLASQPDAELRATALIEKGDTWFAQGPKDPDAYRKAITAWQPLADDSGARRHWSNQALFKTGTAYEKLGESDAALDAYYSVISRGPGGGPAGKEPEFFWFYKSGFEAGSLLEDRKLWKEAIAVYEKIGAVDGPRSAEAAEKVKKLRLANFLWDE
jgi:tetratricopeptide (TPR) repeat protein